MWTPRMNQAAGRHAAVLAAALGTMVLITGCAAGVTGAGTPGTVTSPVTGGSTAPSGNGGCVRPTTASAGDPTPEPAADPVVTVVGEVNGWQTGNLWTQPVALAVYDGGGAVRPVTAGETGATVPAMEWGRMDPCRLDAALDELNDLATADFGQPTVTDQGTTTVTLRSGSAEPQRIDVYALTIESASLPGLTPAQLASRQRLTTALADLQSAVTDAQPWTPNRVRLIGLGGVRDEPTVHPWPGPQGIDESLERTRPDCVTFAGEQAAAVLDQLGTGASTATWTDGRQTESFTVTVLVPGQPSCPE